MRAEMREREEEERTSRTVFMVVLAVCVGDFMFGYDTGVIGGALLFIVPAFGLENEPIAEGFIVSATLITAAICSAACAPVMDRFGRKIVIIAAGVALSTGCLLMAFAFHYSFLVLGRAVIGCGIGILSAAIPLYISEMAPPHWRGFLVGMSQLLVSLGILSSYLVNFLLALFLEESNPNLCWKLMLGVSIVPAVIQLVLAFLIPESPCWLIKKGRIREAGEVLLILHEKTDIEKEMIEAYETAGVPVPQEIQIPTETAPRCSWAFMGNSNRCSQEKTESDPFSSPASLPPSPHSTCDEHSDDSYDSYSMKGSQYDDQNSVKNGQFVGNLTIGGGEERGKRMSNQKRESVNSIGVDTSSSGSSSQTGSGWEEEVEEDRGVMRGAGGFQDYYDFTSSVVKKGLFLGIGLQIFQQITGINAVVYYTPTILDVAGVNNVFESWGLTNDQSSLLATLLVYLPKIPCIYVALQLVDRAGRRLLLLPTIFVMFICLIGLALSFALFLEHDDNSYSSTSLSPLYLIEKTINTITTTTEDESSGVVIAIFCMIFVSVYGCVFSMGLGPLAGILCSEIFPMEVRARAMGICIAIQWSCNILVSQFFPALADSIGQGGAFALFAGMCVLAFFWVLLFIPETKKKSISEIIQLLVPWPFRIDQPF